VNQEQDQVLKRTKAGRGLNAWEAIQMAAVMDLPLSDFGLKDTPENRKKLDQLKDDIKQAEKIGAIVDVVA